MEGGRPRRGAPYPRRDAGFLAGCEKLGAFPGQGRTTVLYCALAD